MHPRLAVLTAALLMAGAAVAMAQTGGFPPPRGGNRPDPAHTLVDDARSVPGVVGVTGGGTLHVPVGTLPTGGFESLFNGKDLSGWDGNPKLWSVKDGAITGQTTAENPISHNTFLIWTNGTVGDFELRCSFRLVPGDAAGFANSGIQYRSQVVNPKEWVVHGYQADMEAGPTYTGILYEEGIRGIMATRGERVVWDKDCKKNVAHAPGDPDPKAIEASIKKGDWNDYVIIAKANHLTHYVNGKMTVDVNDNCEAKRALSGVLALQLHAGHPMMVQFKNIRIRKL